MIDRKHHRIVFAFFMALLMSCIMSLVITLFNVGFVHNIIRIWMKAWAFLNTQIPQAASCGRVDVGCI